MSFTTLIDAATLRGLLDTASLRGLHAGCVLLDCRFDLTDPSAGLRAYRAGHIPGARFADLNRDLSAPVTASTGRHPLPAPAVLAEFFTATGIGHRDRAVQEAEFFTAAGIDHHDRAVQEAEFFTAAGIDHHDRAVQEAEFFTAAGIDHHDRAVQRAEFFSGAGIGNGNDESGGGTQVVAYDAVNGSFAARAWWLLNWLGHREVAVLDGGYQAWVANGGAVETGDAPHVPTTPAFARRQRSDAVMSAVQSRGGRVESGESPQPPATPGFTPRRRPDAVVSAADVLQVLVDPTRLLVDARTPERFSGAVEPLDTVAGHVPGAVNHPFNHNLDAAGSFLPAAELRRRWLERLAGTAPERVIAMCGSGVTACHNLLAMAVAGLPGAKLYAGSWSEWIRSPDRPVARRGSR